MREAHLSAQQSPPQEEARVPLAYADARRPGDREGPASPGPVAAHGLIWRIRDHATFSALRRARPFRRGPVTVRAAVVVDQESPPRVAYAVGRSVGGAVERNRLRRRLRAAVHEERDALCAGWAYLVGAQRGASGLSFTELRSHVQRALRSVGGDQR